MKRQNSPFFKVAMAIGGIWIWLGLIGCATPRNDQVPDWWTNPHKHDEWHLYFTAEGRSTSSYEDARRKAQEVMRSELKTLMMAEVDASNLDYERAIRGALISPEFNTLHGNVEGKVGGTYTVWLMGRYPIQEYNRFRDQFGSEQKTGVGQQAFGGQVVGIYSCISSNGKVSADPEGTRALTQWLVKNGVHTTTASKSLPRKDVAFDSQGAKRIAEAFKSRKADVVFATLLDVDSSKTGAKVGIPGSSEVVDALDATLSYCIIRTSDGRILATDRTTGYSSDRASMLNVVLTHQRHLPSHAPEIANDLGAVQ
jgi:hypothetical protein